MTETVLQQIVNCQQAIVAALDRRDPAAIEESTAKLAEAVARARNHAAWRDDSVTRTSLEHGLKQTDAARMRVNYLSEWTRQRIDSLNELRGLTNKDIYTNTCNR